MSKQKLEPENADKNTEITAEDILLEIGSIGSGQATVALSTMLNEQVNVEVPRLHVKPPHLVPQIYDKHDTAVAAIFMQLRENTSCDLMLIFEEEEAKKIVTLMTGDIKADQEMEKSALEELGSIMLCSFLNAMANFTSTELLPTPPLLIYDAFDAVIDELLSKQALCSDTAAIFDARFKRSTSSAEGYLIMFPSEELQKMMVNKGRKWLEFDGQGNQHSNYTLNGSVNNKVT
ncbi:MAG: chemotaxis protein CheC [Candidatus Bathyarchaeia archaeon]|jgi:chemotaxis protein CheC